MVRAVFQAGGEVANLVKYTRQALVVELMKEEAEVLILLAQQS